MWNAALKAASGLTGHLLPLRKQLIEEAKRQAGSEFRLLPFGLRPLQPIVARAQRQRGGGWTLRRSWQSGLFVDGASGDRYVCCLRSRSHSSPSTLLLMTSGVALSLPQSGHYALCPNRPFCERCLGPLVLTRVSVCVCV